MEKDYIYGFMLADGNLSLYERNRGKLSTEVNVQDADIVYKIDKILPGGFIHERIRSTNFKKEAYKSITYSNYLLEVRNSFLERGFPAGKKSSIANVPKDTYSDKDFWRGFIDGDGSIGYTKDNIPYISLGTISENLYQAFIKFLQEKFGIVKKLHRNKRDNFYNITLKNEDAINVATYLYEGATIYLERKYNKYLEIKKWKRIVKKVNQKSWSEDEDNYITSHSIIESMAKLDRSEASIKMRLFRLKINNK